MSRHNDESDNLDPIDVYVGTKVRGRRLMMGMSQEELADAIGLTFQQVQKYERGTNRISISRLFDICRALKTSYEYFLEGVGNQRKLSLRGMADAKQAGFNVDPLRHRDVLELIRAYSKIRSSHLKKQLLEMAKAMASTDAKTKEESH